MPRPTEPRRGMRAELAWAAGSAVFALALAALALHLWDADLRVPFSYTGDGELNQAIVKDVLEHGWYQHNQSLAAPFGQVLYDFPVVSGDTAQILLMKGIGVFSSDSALVMNLFFLLTFPLTALCAFAAARLLGISRAASALAAVLFALLPYHFVRGEFHLFIGAYWAVPLAAYLVVASLREGGIDLIRPDATGARRALRPAAFVLLCLVIGSAHVYYAAFTILLLAVAALLRLIGGPPRTALVPLVLAAVIGAGVVANHLPNAVYRADHGVNHSLERQASESETYGLKLAAMVLPAQGHRVGPLARLRARYDDTAGEQRGEGPPQALGVVAVAGVIGLLLAGLAAIAGLAGRLPRKPLAGPLAAMTTAAIVIGTVGGGSALFAYLATPQLRAWARISIFIAFFGLLAVALFVDEVGRRRGPRVALALMAVLLIVGFLDQTNAGSVPDYRGNKLANESDAALVGHIEHTLAPGAAVLQLPYVPFPEPQPAWIPASTPYDQLRGYLHSHSLRWSYGLMKGRAGDWQDALSQLPPALVARAAVAAGFTGMWFDTYSFADNGQAALAGVDAETNGAPRRKSPDGRFAFVDLRAYADRMKHTADAAALARLRAAVLRPITTDFDPGFSGVHHDDRGRFRLTGEDAAIGFTNPTAAARRATLQMALEPAGNATADVTLTLPGGATEQIHVPPAGIGVRRAVTLPPGRSKVTLHASGGAQYGLPDVTRVANLRVRDPLLVDGAFKPFGPIPADSRAASWLTPFGAI